MLQKFNLSEAEVDFVPNIQNVIYSSKRETVI